MPVYMIHVDLADSSENLPEIDMALESLARCVRPVPGTWLIEDALSAHQIGNLLEPLIRDDDSLLVTRVGQDAYWSHVDPGAEEWMAGYFKRDQ